MNTVQRISETLASIERRLSAIEDRLDAITEAYTEQHREHYNWELHKRIAGYPGYTK